MYVIRSSWDIILPKGSQHRFSMLYIRKDPLEPQAKSYEMTLSLYDCFTETIISLARDPITQ